MKHYRKIYKVIALWNSYLSLEGSDWSDNPEVSKSMDFCLDEIIRLGVDPNKLPSHIEELIKYLKQL